MAKAGKVAGGGKRACFAIDAARLNMKSRKCSGVSSGAFVQKLSDTSDDL
jgi:hypothetical protein